MSYWMKAQEAPPPPITDRVGTLAHMLAQAEAAGDTAVAEILEQHLAVEVEQLHQRSRVEPAVGVRMTIVDGRSGDSTSFTFRDGMYRRLCEDIEYSYFYEEPPPRCRRCSAPISYEGWRHGGEDCCGDCRDIVRAERNEAEFLRLVAQHEQMAERGPVCTATTKRGNPCCGRPLLETDRCSNHATDPAVRQARDMGMAYGDMGLPMDDVVGLASQVHPSVRKIVIAYAIRETLKGTRRLNSVAELIEDLAGR